MRKMKNSDLGSLLVKLHQGKMHLHLFSMTLMGFVALKSLLHSNNCILVFYVGIYLSFRAHCCITKSCQKVGLVSIPWESTLKARCQCLITEVVLEKAHLFH